MDAKEFQKRAGCIADQYAQYTVVDDTKINSHLTLGDLGGELACLPGLEGCHPRPQARAHRNGFTPEQRGTTLAGCKAGRDQEPPLPNTSG